MVKIRLGAIRQEHTHIWKQQKNSRHDEMTPHTVTLSLGKLANMVGRSD